METLFKWGKFITHSGQEAHWKLECDALSDEDWDTLAKIVAKNISYHLAVGVPSVNGEKFAAALNKISSGYGDYVLLVDDVFTTGRSLEELYEVERPKCLGDRYKGVVVFSRGNCLPWVTSICQINNEFL